MLPNEQLSPPATINSCAVTIKNEIYMFGGSNIEKYNITNAFWKLTITQTEPFIWSNISAQSQDKTPSPRHNHSGWEYSVKM